MAWMFAGGLSIESPTSLLGMLIAFGAPLAEKPLHRLLAVTTRAVTAYLNAQPAAGAQALMVVDTWGGLLGRRQGKRVGRGELKAGGAGLGTENSVTDTSRIGQSKHVQPKLQLLRGFRWGARGGLRDDPELAAQVRLWRADRDALRAQCDAMLLEPVPARLGQAVWRTASPACRLVGARGIASHGHQNRDSRPQDSQLGLPARKMSDVSVSPYQRRDRRDVRHLVDRGSPRRRKSGCGRWCVWRAGYFGA
jgi:hypothetical protein